MSKSRGGWIGRAVGCAMALWIAPGLASATEAERPWFFQGGPRAMGGVQVLEGSDVPIVSLDTGGKISFGRHFGRGMSGPGMAIEAQAGVDTWLGLGLHFRHDIPLKMEGDNGFYVSPVVGASVGVGGVEYMSYGMACGIVDGLFGVRDSDCMADTSPWHARVFGGPEFVWQKSRFRISLRTPLEARLGKTSTAVVTGAEVGFGMSF